MESNSLRFTKYNSLKNRNNKKDELILWDYENKVIYSSLKKQPLKTEYYIWTSDLIIYMQKK